MKIRFIFSVPLFFLGACATSPQPKSMTISTEQISHVTTPMMTPDSHVPRCEIFSANIALAEQKLGHAF